MEKLIEQLLEEWCNAMLALQISDVSDPKLNGAIMCPACNQIHGRCFEAMYPFLHMAKVSKNKKWIVAAEKLFAWAEYSLSQEDGSYLNDYQCDWKGTTVFNSVQLADCLLQHGDILSESTKQAIMSRLSKAANFLYACEEINNNNINYPISNALALYECYLILNEEKYKNKANELALLAQEHITQNNLIFGEGEPRNKKSKRGCMAVDIGYNVEETLPSLSLYGVLANDTKAIETAKKSLYAHLMFMLDDGGIDNSFGTRNFKWTYWGSRTSDGCALGYLLFADDYPEFAVAAHKNITLMKQCTIDGLLAGGPHFNHAKQKPCVHHTFTHAKVLASILDKKLSCEVSINATLPRKKANGIKHYAEIDSYIVSLNTMTATVTAYDWEYLKGGHVTGGSLSLLHHYKAGTLLCAGMSSYSLHEPHNMQVPINVKHECLALRIEKTLNGSVFSSIYENNAQVKAYENIISVKGYLKDINNNQADNANMPYQIVYEWHDDKLVVKAEIAQGSLICPLISNSEEKIVQTNNYIEIKKANATVFISSTNAIELPYENERIFNLTPGLQALKIGITPKNNKAEFSIAIE